MHRMREKRGSIAPFSGMSKSKPVFAASAEECVFVCVCVRERERWEVVVFDLC